MSDKEWRLFLDTLLAGKPLNYDPGVLSEMFENQKYCVSEIRKSLKRINK